MVKYVTLEEGSTLSGRKIIYTENRKKSIGYIQSINPVETTDIKGLIHKFKADVRIKWGWGWDTHKDITLGILKHSNSKKHGKTLVASDIKITILSDKYEAHDCSECTSKCKKNQPCSLIMI